MENKKKKINVEQKDLSLGVSNDRRYVCLYVLVFVRNQSFVNERIELLDSAFGLCKMVLLKMNNNNCYYSMLDAEADSTMNQMIGPSISANEWNAHQIASKKHVPSASL